MDTPPKINFTIRKIQTEQFAILENNFFHDAKVHFFFSFDFQIVNSQGVIVISLRFHFAQNDNPFLVGKVVSHFSVKNEEWLMFCNENQVIIPRLFMVHLAMITVGTARGILHAKTENTIFNRFSFPLINVLDTIKEDIYFNL